MSEYYNPPVESSNTGLDNGISISGLRTYLDRVSNNTNRRNMLMMSATCALVAAVLYMLYVFTDEKIIEYVFLPMISTSVVLFIYAIVTPRVLLYNWISAIIAAVLIIILLVIVQIVLVPDRKKFIYIINGLIVTAVFVSMLIFDNLYPENEHRPAATMV